MDTTNHFAEAAMLIKKPISEVFEAVVNPETITKYWFTHSSARLEKDGVAVWTWAMYNHSMSVLVLELIENDRIMIQWGDDPAAIVTWDFTSLSPIETFVSVKNTGFTGTPEELISAIRDATGGFSWMLAGLKAYMEHNIELNLVADRFPPQLGSH